MTDDAPTPETKLDALRAEVGKKIEPKRLLKKFPIAGGRLVGEYKVAPKKAVRDAAETENDELLLAKCLVRILAEDPLSPSADANGLVPLGESLGRPDLDPLQFDIRLCELIGLPEGTFAETALRLFEGNDLVLATHAGEVAEWSLNTTSEAYTDFPKAA